MARRKTTPAPANVEETKVEEKAVATTEVVDGGVKAASGKTFSEWWEEKGKRISQNGSSRKTIVLAALAAGGNGKTLGDIAAHVGNKYLVYEFKTLAKKAFELK